MIGFPLGANSTELKVIEAERSFQAGAVELDVVLNTGALKADELKSQLEELVL